MSFNKLEFVIYLSSKSQKKKKNYADIVSKGLVYSKAEVRHWMSNERIHHKKFLLKIMRRFQKP